MYNELETDIYLSLEITRNCNLRCTYCYNKHMLTSNDDNFKSIRYMFKKRLVELMQNTNKNIEIDILGGEPSLSIYTVEFLNEIIDINRNYNNVKILTVTTNALKIIQNIEDISDKSILKIEATYHNIFNNIKLFCSNLKYYHDLGINVICTVNLHPDNFDINKVKYILNFCKDNNIKSTLMEVYDFDKNYVLLDKDIIKELYSMITLNKHNPGNFGKTKEELVLENMYKANTGKNCRLLSLNILYDGTISTSCGHKLNKTNILTSSLPINNIIVCNGKLCEGSAGIYQKLQYEKENHD